MTLARGGRPYPDVAALAARVATLEGLSTVLDVGCCWTPEISLFHPELEVVGVGQWGPMAHIRPSRTAFRDYVDLDGDPGRLSQLATSRCVAVLTGPSESLAELDRGLTALGAAIPDAPVIVVATTTPEAVMAHLSAANLQPSFVGRTRVTEGDAERAASLLIVDRSIVNCGAAPSGFSVVAIMTAYNEEDVLEPAIGKLIADGIGVYLIDNWSSDNTYAIAEQFRGRGLVGLERFPDSPTDRFALRTLLGRVSAVAAGLQADWCIHHDADERRCGPWAGVGLRDALWKVDQSGYSAVDHTVLNFRPIDNGFTPGGDFEAYFRHFEFGRSSDLRLQVKAWKNAGPVDLITKAGHEALFPGRRVFPYKFELKHYPIRSQSHGEQKVFRDRAPRWDPRERRLAWHVQYDGVLPGQSFLRDKVDLIEDRAVETRSRLMPEMLAGAGLADYSYPAWALGSRTGRAIYLLRNRVTESRGYTVMSWLSGLPMRAARKMLRLLRGRLTSRSRSGS